MRKRKSQLCEEPSTLVYTLLTPSKLPFKDFSLIIRSLHSYMVEDIVPMETSNTVHVKLNYQASVKNAKAKLGSLTGMVSVHKFSAFVKDDELSCLDKLRKQYGFGGQASNDQGPENNPKRQKTNSAPKKYLDNPVYIEDDQESDNE